LNHGKRPNIRARTSWDKSRALASAICFR
jgi:hypothetical protein